MLLFVARSEVTLGVFNLEPGLLFDWRSQRVFNHTQEKQRYTMNEPVSAQKYKMRSNEELNHKVDYVSYLI